MDSDAIGPYRLSYQIGVGGMGEVWKARRKGLADTTKYVAIKVLREEFEDIPALREMFLSEARQAMRLNNANIVQVFDVDQTAEGRCYMVMEYIDGLDLARLSKHLREQGQGVPLSVSAYIIGELLKALACIHEFGDGRGPGALVHRDLTPDNVMLSVWGEVKIMDFGVARLSSDTTHELYAPGKLRYMAPEQLSEDGCDPTLDLFALGAILHELLDGRNFRESFEESKLYEMVSDGEVEELREPERVPPVLAELRQELLAVDPSQRIASARAAYAALSQWPGFVDAHFELEGLVRRFAPLFDEIDEIEEIEGSVADMGLSRLSKPDWSSRTSTSLDPAPARAPARPPPPPRPRSARLGLLLVAFVTGLVAAATSALVLRQFSAVPPDRCPDASEPPTAEPSTARTPESSTASTAVSSPSDAGSEDALMCPSPAPSSTLETSELELVED